MYLAALALTLLVEVPLYVLAITAATPVRGWRVPAVAVAVNLLTHPALWWTATGADPLHLTLAELAVCAVEGVLVRAALRIPWAVALVSAVAANAASVLVGALLLG